MYEHNTLNQKSSHTRVIIIDDDVTTVEVFVEYLELCDVNVVATAYDGQDAVKVYKQYEPDIIFVDVMMPIYDGCYALENIRKIDPDAVVIMVTADLSKETGERLEKLGATRIIYKPFDIKELIDCIETYKKQ